MSSSQSTIDGIIAKSSGAGEVTAKMMFGGHGLFCQGKMFAVVDDDILFIKSTAAGDEIFPDAERVPPYPGAKPCLVIPPEKIEDDDWLVRLILETVQLLPAPKPKKK